MVVHDAKLFNHVEPFLASENFVVSYAHTLVEAIHFIQTNDVDVLLISWNLPLINVAKTFEFLEDKLRSMVVVFSERDKPQIVKELMASRIPRTIFPPLSGPGVIKRLDQLIRQRAAEELRKQQALGVGSVSGEEVPEDIEWESTPTPGQTTDGDKLWQGVSAKDENTTFVYQGAAAPKWDKSKKSWQGNGKLFMKIGQEARGLMSGVLGQPIRKKAKVKVMGDAGGGKKYQLPVTNQEDGSALFYESLNNAIEIIKGVLCDPSEIEYELDAVTVSWIQSESMNGMILIGDPTQNQEALSVLNSIQSSVAEQAVQKKEKYELLIEKAVINIPPADVNLWASRKTKYVYGIKSAENKMVMAYMPVEIKIEYALDETGQYYALSIDQLIRPGVRVPCDIYVFMKKNQKFVRYIGRDQVISESTLEKLQQSQITNVMIHKDDLERLIHFKSKGLLNLQNKNS